MYINNINDIDHIIIKYPELMHDNANDTMYDLIKEMFNKRNELQEARQNVIRLEKEVQAIDKNFNEVSPMFDIVFKEKEHTTPIHEKCNLQIINPSDYRNHD